MLHFTTHYYLILSQLVFITTELSTIQFTAAEIVLRCSRKVQAKFFRNLHSTSVLSSTTVTTEIYAIMPKIILIYFNKNYNYDFNMRALDWEEGRVA